MAHMTTNTKPATTQDWSEDIIAQAADLARQYMATAANSVSAAEKDYAKNMGVLM